MAEISGNIFHIMRFAINDGPGIRTTLFFKGCPLRCAWCHNPESISPHPELMINSDRCIGCGACIPVCPQNAISSIDGRIATDRSRCQVCGRCAQACPADARSLTGRRMTVAEVMQEIEKDRIFFDQSGGGVTLSGGEPLTQAEFATAILQACRKKSIHTTVDTSGAVPRVTMERLIDQIDLFLYDIKFIDETKLQQFTGAVAGNVAGNLEWLLQRHPRVIVRVPVIPGFNDGDDDWGRLAAFLGRFDRIEAVHLLPFHSIGRDKYARLGKEYTLGELVPPDEKYLQSLAIHLNGRVIIGG